MSGWEKYVEQAAEALDPEPFDAADPHHASPAYQFRRELACDRVGRVLAAVGPLIAEDARERMVAAAGKALEREGPVTDMAIPPSREALAIALHDSVCPDRRCEPTVMGKYFTQADAVLALLPSEADTKATP